MKRFTYTHACIRKDPVAQRSCDFPGCDQPGLHRAPQGRDRLRHYYWFCLKHVREYNEHWDYLEGLDINGIEMVIRHATVWERPTWPFSQSAAHRRRTKKPRTQAKKEKPMVAGEKEALAALDLAPPIAFPLIKARYRALVKRHHPDANGGQSEAEEKIKTINQAFTILRRIYGH